MTEVVVRETASSAEEFLDVINRRNPRWPGPQKTWIFRGQAEDWPLLPSALRPSATFPTEHHGSGFPSGREPWQLFMPRVSTELDVAAVFLESLDAAGLPVPGDGPSLRSLFDLRVSEDESTGANLIMDVVRNNRQWPPEHLLPLFALAQHYGLPTRLLDWSYSPLIAAYFAAKEVAQTCAKQPAIHQSDKTIVVWGLNTRELFTLTSIRRSDTGRTRDGITIVHAPPHSNPNLAAQKGVFTLDRRRSLGDDQDYGTQPLDLAVVAAATAFTGEVFPTMRQITLPWTESRKLLRLLAIEGVSACQLFPGHGGAATSCWERLLWDDFEPYTYRAK